MNLSAGLQNILSLLQSRQITPEEAFKRLSAFRTTNEGSGKQASSPSPGRKSSIVVAAPAMPKRQVITQAPSEDNVSQESAVMLPNMGKTKKQELQDSDSHIRDRVAIIGMSGRYPGAATLQQFWQNLVAGKSSIQEVPRSRWDVNAFYDPRPQQSGKIYCKWLGILDDIDCFDPLFFGISPAEAEAMDPQQRLFLQEAYRGFESAGYSPRSLGNRRCGVYLGLMGSEYGVMLHNSIAAVGASAALGKSAAVAAGRIAYHLDLKGPAISIDTACSSSLVATHLACQALLNREIDLALVGGTTLYLTAQVYIGMCAAGMLSPEGRCKTFDNSADGFVPGEGVGALVLKRLADAEVDHDPIRGVIAGSGINQDGKTNGITAPSVTSQIELAREIYQKYHVDPDDISYVEMHGTGTKLGDPIELEALSTVFREHTDRKQFCAIGSVKSNIGHTSAAAGVASIHKVLLALEHGELPATLNFVKANEHFAFNESPFFVNTERRPWMATPGKPRRAAISAFGFSGTNAHMVIEEYVRPHAEHLPTERVLVFVISARTKEQLRESARLLCLHLKSGESQNLQDVAYTLQTAREAMEHRCAFLVNSREELLRSLDRIAEGATEGTFTGQVKDNRKNIGILEDDEDAQALVQQWMRKLKLEKLAEVWAKGYEINWNDLYAGVQPRRIALPTYPFARQRYWLSQERSESSQKTGLLRVCSIHPLVQRNLSTFHEQEYSSTFTGTEFFLADHSVQGTRIMPGVAFLEMAVSAVSHALEIPLSAASVCLSEHVWLRPLAVAEEAVEVYIALEPQADDGIRYEIYTVSRSTPRAALSASIAESECRVVHAQGKATVKSEVAEVPVLDLAAIQKQCPHFLAGETCYLTFTQSGMEYGPAFRGLDSVFIESSDSPQAALARVRLPTALKDTFANYVLHPSIMDAALQASSVFSIAKDKNVHASSGPALAFSLDQLELFVACPEDAWVWLRASQLRSREDKPRKIDFDICDGHGRVCVRLKGFATATKHEHTRQSSTLKRMPMQKHSQLPIGTLTLAPVWEPRDSLPASPAFFSERLVVVGNTNEVARAFQEHYFQSYELHIKAGSTIAEITRDLQLAMPFEHLLWVSSDPLVQNANCSDPNEDEPLDKTLLFGFRVIKALMGLGFGDKPLRFTMVTREAQAIRDGQLSDPFQAGIHGLIGAMGREFPNWQVRIVDLEERPGLNTKDLILPWDRDCVWVRRGRQWFTPKLVPCELSDPQQSSFRKGGVYIIIGGAGRVGEALSEYLLRNYQAQVIWLGRREMNSGIAAKIERLSKFGPAPTYMTADASNRDALECARLEIKERCGNIHAVIHSALDFAIQGLAEMDESQFRARLASKIDVSLRIAEVFGSESLDFLLFFSSIASFIRNSNQSHYAAGCAFTDAFAKRLRLELSCPIKIVNWGYWQENKRQTIETSDVRASYRERMQQLGISCIEPEEAMAFLEKLLQAPIDQLAFIKTCKPDAAHQMGLNVDAAEMMRFARGPKPSACRILQSSQLPLAQIEFSSYSDSDTHIFNDLLAKLLLGQLQSLGFGLDPKMSLVEWKSKAALLEKYSRWLQESVVFLAERAYLRVQDDCCTSTDTAPLNMQGLWSEWEECKTACVQDPNLSSRVRLLDVTLRALPEILTGNRRSTDVIFPDSSMELVENLYRSTPVAEHVNHVLAEVMGAYLERRKTEDRSTRLRLCEVGAGTGGSTAALLQKCGEHREQIETYCYTDISSIFLQQAQERFGKQYSYLKCLRFDVELDPPSQGFEPGSYDVVIAANVLHATRNIRNSLRNLKTLLKRSGLLLLVEIAGKNLFRHLTFGLLEGWWAYEDDAMRIPGCPGLAPETWQRVLEEEGFSAVSLLTPQAHDLGQQVIAAESDGVMRLSRPIARSEGVSSKSIEVTVSHPLVNTDSAATSQKNEITSETTTRIGQHIRDVIVENLSHCLKMDVLEIDLEESFADYGVDSILGIKLIQNINRDLQIELSVTSLFDYTSVTKLTWHVMEQYGAALALAQTESLSNAAFSKDETKMSYESTDAEPAAAQSRVYSKKRFLSAPGVVFAKGQSPAHPQPIAIIGISGRYPGSANLNELWNHLAQGHELIQKTSRWESSAYGSPDDELCPVGGFLSDIDCFDPLFFNISGNEAAYMDPQQRIFLQEAWKALEDAGYAGSAVSGRKCGIYVGYNGGDYRQLLREEVPAQAMWGNAPSVLSARIAYYLNLIGPAITIDSACSSSLVAVHLACQGLWSGETEMALAGGVSVLCTPWFHGAAGRAGMLSPTGHCYTFDTRADGFVPGEGAGVIVLKRLQDAVADGDHLYGVIRGSGINQDGTTNGITAPSALSQERLEREVYDRFQIHPEEIQLVEAHGTGTRLGDPIEFQAITKAFGHYTSKKQFCAIGSIKTNIGHTTAAAGVAGVLKVLLSLQNRQIPPSLNYEQGNPHINFENSPFFVNTTLRDWKVGDDQKRCAAVSSFGMSGTNAHLVIGEPPGLVHHPKQRPGYLIALSARNLEQLRDQARQLVEHCRKYPSLDCGNMSYTLLVGRKHLEQRLACVISDAERLIQELEDWLKSKVSRVLTTEYQPKTIHRTESNRDQEHIQCYSQIGHPKAYLESLSSMAELYVSGRNIPLEQLFAGDEYSRISLPAYPFAMNRYWVPDAGELSASRSAPVGGGVSEISVLHPLLHRNTSDLLEQRFTSQFTGKEFFLADHVIKDRTILPAVAYLEMARAAIGQANALSVKNRDASVSAVKLRNVVWPQPFSVEHGSSAEVHVSIYLDDRGDIAFEIYTLAGSSTSEKQNDPGERIVHAQGLAEMTKADDRLLNLDRLKQICCQAQMSGKECYRLFQAHGLHYGPAYRGLKEVHIGSDDHQGRQALGRVDVPTCVQQPSSSFVLHPSFMDAALQATIGLTAGDCTAQSATLALPFALDEVEVFQPTAVNGWVWVRYSTSALQNDNLRKIDADVCDVDGKVCARLKGLTFRSFEHKADTDLLRTVLFTRTWTPQAVESSLPNGSVLADRWLIIAEPGMCARKKAYPLYNELDLLKSKVPASHWCLLESRDLPIEERFETYAGVTVEILQRLFQSKPQRDVLFQVVVPAEEGQPLLSGLAGLLKTARMENGRLIGQIIGIEEGESAAALLHKLDNNPRTGVLPTVIRYHKGERLIETFEEIVGELRTEVPWKMDGVYVLSGGAGGLGLLFAQEIAHHANDGALILVGRSLLSSKAKDAIAKLQNIGMRVEYRQVDVTDPVAVQQLVRDTRVMYGKIDGVLHCAGLTHDGFLVNKRKEELRAVLAPKIRGLINLDKATCDLNLDIFLLFSSVAGALGNVGQADYAAANAFMDGYAEYRNLLAGAGERCGKTLSINWPLWAEGGMQVDSATRERLLQSGSVPLSERVGMQALYQAVASGHSQVLVLAGDRAHLRQRVSSTRSLTVEENQAPSTPVLARSDNNRLCEVLEGWLLHRVSELLKVDMADLDPYSELSEFGFDSISVTHFTNLLNQAYHLSLMPTIFYEYPTIRSFAAYLVGEYPAAIGQRFAVSTSPAEAPTKEGDTRSESMHLHAKTVRTERVSVVQKRSTAEIDKIRAYPEPVAIIGMSGRFPQAPDVNAFWQNLQEGRDCITEIPAERWDWQAYYGDPTQEPGKTNIKWGGFIEGVDEFDPLFFGISPRDATLMDPQQRLMMMYVWKAIEDAGYSAQEFNGTKTAILIGTAGSDYNWLLAKGNEIYSATGIVPSVGPNRISYLLNMHGPSEPVETACSSSLVAIHRGMSLICRGECEMAIVGGVNTIISPRVHISFSKAGMLSEDGRCKTFSNAANGYVRGEGVGMLVLKSLSAAERDGDHIYAVLRGSAENHGGRANSFTAPNPMAQAQVIKDALAAAGIDPRTVTYIEAHGTGTALGDPIEINGLKSAFQQLYQEWNLASCTKSYCGLGSVKTNIGHLELAAGIAGVIKVVLQLRYKLLVKSLHSEELNPYIQLSETPFYIVRANQPWAAVQDEHGRELPRRAGISSFGFGGVNAHVVVEEYLAPEVDAHNAASAAHVQPALVLLSARRSDVLRQQAVDLLEACSRLNEGDLGSLAYTLQVGRDPMSCRLALIARSLVELKTKLQQFLHGEENVEQCYHGEAKQSQQMLSLLAGDEDLQHISDLWVSKGKYSKLLELWVHGIECDWKRLYTGAKPRRLSLPTYPFAREKYWLPQQEARMQSSSAKPSTSRADETIVNRLLDDLMNETVTVEDAAAEALTVLGQSLNAYE